MDVMSKVFSMHVFSMRIILCSVFGLQSMLDNCVSFRACVIMLRLILRRVFVLLLLARNSNISLFLL